jgi:hypothetical protein
MNMDYFVEVVDAENGTLYFDFQELLYAVKLDGPVRYLKTFEEPMLVLRQGHHPYIALDGGKAHAAALWPRGTKGFVLPLPEIKSAMSL